MINKHILPFFTLLLLLSLLLASCEQANPQNQQGSTDSTAMAGPEAEDLSAPLMGRWELKAKALPDLGEIPLGGDFYTFQDSGKLRITHPNDPDLPTELIRFSIDPQALSFNNINYEILHLSEDSLVLQTETDGIEEKSIFLRAAKP
jgi:hypothetical protein